MAAAHWTSFLSAILCRSLWQTHTDICICTSWEWNTPRSPLTSTQKLSRAPRLSFCLPEGNIQSRWGLESKQHRVSCRDNKAGDKMKIIVWPAFISPHINFWIHEEEKPRVCPASHQAAEVPLSRTGPPVYLSWQRSKQSAETISLHLTPLCFKTTVLL